MSYTYERQPAGYYSAVPLPTAAQLADHYSNNYFQAPVSKTYSVSYDATEIAYKRLRASAHVALAKQHIPSVGSFADIGAGEGFAMQAAANAGFDVSGADFSSHGMSSFHPELVDRLFVGDAFAFLASNQRQRTFSVVSATNILEHVIDPAGFLSLARGITDPDGICIVTVPNDFSRLHHHLIETKAIDREFWFAPPEHLHYFNADNFPVFARSCGMSVVDVVADFPIDLFLLNPAANYVLEPKNGPHAHRARMTTDLLLAERGLERYIEHYRSLAATGFGRNLSFVMRPADETLPE